MIRVFKKEELLTPLIIGVGVAERNKKLSELGI